MGREGRRGEPPPAFVSAGSARPNWDRRRDPQGHPRLGRSPVSRALVAAAAGGHGVEPGIPASDCLLWTVGNRWRTTETRPYPGSGAGGVSGRRELAAHWPSTPDDALQTHPDLLTVRPRRVPDLR